MASALPAALLASVSLFAPAPAPVADSPDVYAAPAMFAISAEQADRILRQALAREFAGAHVRPVSQPYAGFVADGRYAMHSYTVSAYRVPAIGRLADGSLLEGFRFDVRASGTMPKSTQTAVARLIRDIDRRASLLAEPRALVSAPGSDLRRAALDDWRVPDWFVLVGLTLGLVVGLAVGSGLSRFGARDPGVREDRPPFADRSWWSSELLEMTHDAVIVWEMDGGGILYWNHAAEKLYGFERDEAHGKITHELLATQLAGTVSDLEAKLARYGVWVGELIHTARDGRRISVEGRLALLSQRDGRWLVLEVNRDLTNRSQAAAARTAMEDRMVRLRKPNVQLIH